MFQIYALHNMINDKIYVGQTLKSIEGRFREHVNAAKRGEKYMPVGRAILKYGENIWLQQCLGIADHKDKADNLERIWIILLNSLVPNGYNVAIGGTAGTMLGRKHTEETRAKIAKSHVGIGKGEHRSSKSEFKSGEHRSPKTEFKPGQSQPFKGMKRPELSGENHWTHQPGYECTTETRAKMSAAKSGGKHHFFGKKRPEHSIKMREYWRRRKEGRD